jgi:hypothetical protein
MFKNHWTYKYIVNRIIVEIYYKLNPQLPWITKNANDILRKSLNSEYIGIEFGSGRSTLWIASKVKTLFSIEDNNMWYKATKLKLEDQKLRNVEYFYLDSSKKDNTEYSEYTAKILEFQDEYFDFIFIDGSNRDELSLLATSKLKNNGLLIIDNINWYVPSNSLSPSSIKIDEKPFNRIWEEFITKVELWDMEWTTNGVWDTVIYTKKATKI